MDYFDADYFDGSYFDTPTAVIPPPPTTGGAPRRRASIFIQPPAEIEEITDDGWIHILL